MQVAWLDRSASLFDTLAPRADLLFARSLTSRSVYSIMSTTFVASASPSPTADWSAQQAATGRALGERGVWPAKAIDRPAPPANGHITVIQKDALYFDAVKHRSHKWGCAQVIVG